MIYDSLKKGHKINIGKDINDNCRKCLINNDWDDSEVVVEAILSKIMNTNRYIHTLSEISTKEELKELKELLRDKIVESLYAFKYQKPTARQVYRYIDACSKVGEKYKKLMTNGEIWQETTRLEKEINDFMIK